jgi:signal peptidase II
MMVRGLSIAVVVAVLDQASKWWLLGFMQARPPAERIVSLAPFLDIVLVWNRGVSFGLFNNDAGFNAIIFTVVAAVIVTLLLVWLSRSPDKLIAIGIGLVIGGAVGNVVDRLRFSAVIDFIDVHVAGWHWPAFNVADSAICIGVAFMVIDSLLGRRELRT